jgi:hypothetical protein
MKNKLEEALELLKQSEADFNIVDRIATSRGIALAYYIGFVDENNLSEQFEAYKQKVDGTIKAEEMLAQLEIVE